MSNARPTGLRSVTTYTQTINAPPDRVYPLICPVREAEWTDGWACQPIYALSGLAEADGVYAATDHAGQTEPTIWVITRRDPVHLETEFVAFVPGQQVFRLSVQIKPLGTDQSNVLITYVRTGVSEAGNAAIARAQRLDADRAMIELWERAMNHYLATGRLLKSEDTSSSERPA